MPPPERRRRSAGSRRERQRAGDTLRRRQDVAGAAGDYADFLAKRRTGSTSTPSALHQRRSHELHERIVTTRPSTLITTEVRFELQFGQGSVVLATPG